MVGDSCSMRHLRHKVNFTRDCDSRVFSPRNTGQKSMGGVKLPSIVTSADTDRNRKSEHDLNGFRRIPADEVCLRRKLIQKPPMTRKDEARTGLNYIKSPDKPLQDIMEDDAVCEDDPCDSQPAEICISSASTDSSDRDDRKEDDEVFSYSEKNASSSPTEKGKRRVRFSLPGMGGRCIYPARVEEDYRRYRRYSSPSLFGDENYPYADESESDFTKEQNDISSPRRRKTSLPPITNYTVETFYERQVESVDKLANSLISRDYTKPSPREDSPTKSSLGSAHFQAAMSISLSDDDDSDEDEPRGSCNEETDVANAKEEETVAKEQSAMSSPPVSPNDQSSPSSPASPSLITLDPPLPSTPRRRRVGVVQNTPPVFKLMESDTTDPLPTPRKETSKSVTPSLSLNLGSLEQTNGRDIRSPRTSTGTPPIVRTPTPRLLKRRTVSLGQTSRPDPSALQGISRSPIETSKTSPSREYEMKVLERKLQTLEVRKKEVKTQSYISETISQIFPDRQRNYRVRRKSLPSTMPPSPVFVPPEIDFASLENCRYLRRKPSEEELDDIF